MITPFMLKIAFSALVVLAALEDAWRLRISNWLSIALLLLFALATYLSPRDVAWLDHLAGALLLFAVGAVLFVKGWMGGGDVKLLAAVALWVGLSGLAMLLVYTTIAGGLLTIVLFAVRRAIRPPQQQQRHHLIRRQGPIPYGIAISIGALLMLGRMPLVADPAVASVPLADESNTIGSG